MNRCAKVKRNTLLVWRVLPLCAKASGTGRGGARPDGWGFWKLFYRYLFFLRVCVYVCRMHTHGGQRLASVSFLAVFHRMFCRQGLSPYLDSLAILAPAFTKPGSCNCMASVLQAEPSLLPCFCSFWVCKPGNCFLVPN